MSNLVGYALTDRTSGPALYFTLNSVQMRGGEHTWVGDKSQALLFARELDAKEFISRYLTHQIHLIDLEKVTYA